MQLFLFNFNKESREIHLEILNEASAPFRRCTYAVRAGQSRQWRVSHHALGARGEFSLQSLQEQRACPELEKDLRQDKNLKLYNKQVRYKI